MATPPLSAIDLVLCDHHESKFLRTSPVREILSKEEVREVFSLKKCKLRCTHLASFAHWHNLKSLTLTLEKSVLTCHHSQPRKSYPWRQKNLFGCWLVRPYAYNTACFMQNLPKRRNINTSGYCFLKTIMWRSRWINTCEKARTEYGTTSIIYYS